MSQWVTAVASGDHSHLPLHPKAGDGSEKEGLEGGKGAASSQAPSFREAVWGPGCGWQELGDGGAGMGEVGRSAGRYVVRLKVGTPTSPVEFLDGALNTVVDTWRRAMATQEGTGRLGAVGGEVAVAVALSALEEEKEEDG